MREQPATTMPKRPKVSIMLITYNHGKYIAQAIESILMQETEYDYEINVIEDCSTDNTQEIIMRYVEKYPDKVKPFFNKQNIGYKVTQKNFFRGFKTLNGEYIAILEGDDYWSSPHKLQKQIAFLEANPSYVACAHNVIKVYENSDKEPHRFLYWPGRPATHTIEDMILLRSYFHTTTLTYRNVFNGNPPPQFENPWSCDIFITIAHTQFGNIRYFDEDMSVYRAHEGGRFSNMKTLEGWYFNIGGLRRYNEWLGYRYLRYFSHSIFKYCNSLLRDKGKEAALPTLSQRIKYEGIRALYFSIFVITYLVWKTPFMPKRLRVTGKSVAGRVAFCASILVSTILYPFRLFILASQMFLRKVTFTLYLKLVRSLPADTIKKIREMEKRNIVLATIRKTARRKAVFTKRGAWLITMTLLKRRRRAAK